MKQVRIYSLPRPAEGGGYKRLYALVISLLMALAAILPLQQASAEEVPSGLPGLVVGTGTSFSLTDSDYLNISVSSTEEITLHLNSFPTAIEMQVEPTDQSGPSTLITISGLDPDTPYWVYEDDAIEPLEIISDSAGGYELSLDLSTHHHLRIQPGKSTYYLFDDTSLGAASTGGDCAGNVYGGNGDIGAWDPTTRTCTLDQNVNDSLIIDDPYNTNIGITLDGNGYTVSTPNWGAIQIKGLNHTVHNVRVNKVSATPTGAGFQLSNSHNVILSDNNIYNSYYGIYSFNSSGNVFDGNVIENHGIGVYLDGYYFKSNCDAGSLFYCGSSNNLINNNSIVSPAVHFSIGVLIGLGARNNTVSGNLVSDHHSGINLYDYYCDNDVIFDPRFCPQDNTFFHNNLISNTSQLVAIYGGSGSVFNLPAAEGGGNYYDNYDEPAEGCSDTDVDGFCDAARPVTPYYGSGPHYTDALPLTTPQILGSNTPPVADAGPDQTVEATANPDSPVTLDGTGSYDDDNDLLSYSWTNSFGTVNGEMPTVYLSLGSHNITLEVDDGTETATDEVVITVEDTTAPVITPPDDITVYATGPLTTVDIGDASVDELFPDTLESDDPGQFAPGITTVTWTATDTSGNIGTATQTITVEYDWAGFFDPVENLPTLNTVKGGQTVPIKWSVPTPDGSYIRDTSIVSSLNMASVACEAEGTAYENPIEAETSGNSGLSYDMEAEQYVYRWKTLKSMAGTCALFILTLNDGSEHYAKFKVK